MGKAKIVKKFNLKEFKAISHAFSTYEDLSLLTNHFAEMIAKLLGVKGCCIMLYDDREQQLYRVGCYGISKKYLDKGPVFFNDKHSSLVTGEPTLVENMQSDPRVQYPEEAAMENIISMLSVPIKWLDSKIGILRIYHNDVFKIHDEDLDSICVLALHLGLVIENNGLQNFLNEVKSAIGNLPLKMLQGLQV